MIAALLRPGAILLDRLGQHATAALAAGVLIGLLVPSLAQLASPFLVPGLVIPLTIALLRLDWSALWRYSRRPWLVGGLVAWMLLISPIVMTLATAPLGLPAPLRTALVLMAAAPPIVSSVALCFILGLDAALSVVVVVISTALVPLTLPPVSLWLLGLHLDLSLLALMGRLGVLVASAFLAAGLLRGLLSTGWISAHARQLDGLSVATMVLFAIAIMDGVTAAALARPGYIGLVAATSFVANLALQALGAAVYRRTGRSSALAVGLMTGNCNMGLLLVALNGRADFDITVYFAVAQLPMYILPAALLPLYRRLLRSGTKPV